MARRVLDLSGLKNIGPTIKKRLNQIGVTTKADLARIGPVRAYQRICQKNPGKTIPVCYYLYSLQGALMGVHWDRLPKRMKNKLVLQATGKLRRIRRGSR